VRWPYCYQGEEVAPCSGDSRSHIRLSAHPFPWSRCRFPSRLRQRSVDSRALYFINACHCDRRLHEGALWRQPRVRATGNWHVQLARMTHGKCFASHAGWMPAPPRALALLVSFERALRIPLDSRSG
jgi:hypothetical protein